MGDTKNNDTENLTWLRDEYNHCVFILNHFELQLHDVRQEFTQKFGVVQTTSGRNVASKLLKKTWTHTSQNLLGLNVTKISKDQAQLFSARFDQIQDQMESVRDSANGPLSALQE